MTNINAFSNPESHLIGLYKDQGSGAFLFAIPKPGKKGVDTATSAAFASFYSILDAKEKLPKASASLKYIGFVASKHIAGAAVDILVGQLLDTALADTLRTLGDVSLRAATAELEDANNEPTRKGKERHRMLAQGHLGVVFQAAQRELTALEKKLLPYTDRRAEAHRKATLVAAAIALINRDAGMQAAAKWAEKAKTHFERYDKLKGDTDREVLARMDRQESKLQSSRAPIVRHPIYVAPMAGAPWVLRKTALRDLEKARRPILVRVTRLDEERSHFEVLYGALRS
ncbi:hypothetical protein [Streptomyces rishiriensis]|uniref:Uncharacterized protein n=1 Tax=Streptomyces rishiriensis TaxID=68264 RepID=A0ABU0NGQ2_STRRH|nr:hypothetical protein [Streptomyces rishiriensis]MDQ0578283.1 hypothetical protein [Streptomyces rishiriensis]